MSRIIDSTYEIIGVIGTGGGGTVFLARHKRMGKKVVLKADKRKITTREDLLRREVDTLKNLSNTYIPQVYKPGQTFSMTIEVNGDKAVIKDVQEVAAPDTGDYAHLYIWLILLITFAVIGSEMIKKKAK